MAARLRRYTHRCRWLRLRAHNQLCQPDDARWTFFETKNRFNPNDASDGFVCVYEDGRLVCNYNGRTLIGGTQGQFFFGNYARRYNQPNNWRYYTDLSLDNSLARIVIGNGSTLDTSNVRAAQPPSAWSNTSVTFKAWQGAHQKLAGNSLFVVTPDDIPVKVGTFG